MLISDEVLETFISMPTRCRNDIKNINPGWGYVGPIARGFLKLPSIEMKVADARTGDVIEKGDFLKTSNWIRARTPGDVSLLRLRKDSDIALESNYFPAWIPSDFEKVMAACHKLINTTGYEITNVIMDKSVENLGSITIGFELDDEMMCTGTGNSFISSSLGFYKRSWEFNYEYHRPSISNIESRVSITNSYNDEPTIEFDHFYECRREFLNKYGKFYKYGTFKKEKDLVKDPSDRYIGEINLMEGEFHVMTLNGAYSERLLLF